MSLDSATKRYRSEDAERRKQSEPCPHCGEPVTRRLDHYVPSVGYSTEPATAIEPYWVCEA